MNVVTTPLAGLLILEPRVFGDERGFFFESFNAQRFEAATGVPGSAFVQDNHSRSQRGVLRGMHYQRAPHAQGKLVRVTEGEVFDLVIDLRPNSPTRGQSFGVVLDAASHRQLWVPPGFAHGFVVLSERADFLYKTTDYYAPQAERSIRWDDPAIAHLWPLQGITPQVSAKDAVGISLDQALAEEAVVV